LRTADKKLQVNTGDRKHINTEEVKGKKNKDEDIYTYDVIAGTT
jgi:hypothetical protein